MGLIHFFIKKDFDFTNILIVDNQLNLMSNLYTKNNPLWIFINILSKGNNLANGKKKVNSIS